MQLLEFLLLLVVAGVCGALGQAITGFKRGGIIVSMALGFIGALLGTWIARQLALPEVLAIDVGGSRFPIIWSVVGAALFVAVLALLTKGKSK